MRYVLQFGQLTRQAVPEHLAVITNIHERETDKQPGVVRVPVDEIVGWTGDLATVLDFMALDGATIDAWILCQRNLTLPRWGFAPFWRRETAPETEPRGDELAEVFPDGQPGLPSV